MSLLRSWLDRRRQQRLLRRTVHSPELNWTIQLPAHFTLRDRTTAQKLYDLSARMMGAPANNSIYKDGNITALFSSHYDKFNILSGATTSASGNSPDQISLSRDDCKDRLLKMFSKMDGTTTQQYSSTTLVGGKEFEQYTYVIRKSGRPILCFEYICQIIGQYELSISIYYNNESHRQEIYKSLEGSKFA